jgi:hypothetical protein
MFCSRPLCWRTSLTAILTFINHRPPEGRGNISLEILAPRNEEPFPEKIGRGRPTAYPHATLWLRCAWHSFQIPLKDFPGGAAFLGWQGTSGPQSGILMLVRHSRPQSWISLTRKAGTIQKLGSISWCLDDSYNCRVPGHPPARCQPLQETSTHQ